MLAIEKNDQELANTLLDAGANVNLYTQGGYTALFLAINSIKNDDSPLIPIIKKLLEKKANPNIAASAHSHLTPLMLATYTQLQSVVKLLLEYGANIHQKLTDSLDLYGIRPPKGSTALDIAKIIEESLKKQYTYAIKEDSKNSSSILLQHEKSTAILHMLKEASETSTKPKANKPTEIKEPTKVNENAPNITEPTDLIEALSILKNSLSKLITQL